MLDHVGLRPRAGRRGPHASPARSSSRTSCRSTPPRVVRWSRTRAARIHPRAPDPRGAGRRPAAGRHGGRPGARQPRVHPARARERARQHDGGLTRSSSSTTARPSPHALPRGPRRPQPPRTGGPQRARRGLRRRLQPRARRLQAARLGPAPQRRDRRSRLAVRPRRAPGRSRDRPRRPGHEPRPSRRADVRASYGTYGEMVAFARRQREELAGNAPATSDP